MRRRMGPAICRRRMARIRCESIRVSGRKALSIVPRRSQVTARPSSTASFCQGLGGDGQQGAPMGGGGLGGTGRQERLPAQHLAAEGHRRGQGRIRRPRAQRRERGLVVLVDVVGAGRLQEGEQGGLAGEGGGLGVEGRRREIGLVVGGRAHAPQSVDGQQGRAAEERSRILHVDRRQQLGVDLVRDVDGGEAAAPARVRHDQHLVVGGQARGVPGQPVEAPHQAARRGGVAAVGIGGEIVVQRGFGAGELGGIAHLGLADHVEGVEGAGLGLVEQRPPGHVAGRLAQPGGQWRSPAPRRPWPPRRRRRDRRPPRRPGSSRRRARRRTAGRAARATPPRWSARPCRRPAGSSRAPRPGRSVRPRRDPRRP